MKRAAFSDKLHRLQLPRIIRDSHENIASQSATHRITLGLLSATELILEERIRNSRKAEGTLLGIPGWWLLFCGV